MGAAKAKAPKSTSFATRRAGLARWVGRRSAIRRTRQDQPRETRAHLWL